MKVSLFFEKNVGANYSDVITAIVDNAIADQQFRVALVELKAIAADLAEVESELQAEGAPWTPGRMPDWP